MTYVVNGTEYTKKSEATKAIYEALEAGDVTVSKPEEVEEAPAAPAPDAPNVIL